MCGLVGLLALGKLNKQEEAQRQRFMRFASTELMLRTDERGKDATGAAILFTDGNYAGIKRGEETNSWFAKFGSGEDRYGRLIKVWEEYEQPVKIYLGHCRKGTTGDKEDNENNHPIKINNIVGIHNGVIKNHKEVKEHLGCKCDGEVDSEVIFRLMDYFTNEGKEPWTMDSLEKIIARLTGAWAVMAFNADNPNQMPLFRDGRPIELILIKELSLLVILSDIKFWNSFHFQYERTLFYARFKGMPSLLGMNIEKKTMADDSAAIIDLTNKCIADTTIEDIWEWKKIRRDNKIWTSSAALQSTAGGVGAYSGGQSMLKTESTDNHKKPETTEKTETTTSTTTSNEKMRVFNNITRKFEIKNIANPKTIKDNESVVLPVGDTKTTETKINTTFADDLENQDDSNDILTIEDYTDYKTHLGNVKMLTSGSEDTYSNTKSDIIDVKPSTGDTSDDVVAITEVDMTVDNVELMALAKASYDKLPNEDKGYADIDHLLTDIDIKDEDTANKLGMKIVSNRVAGVQWIKGFIYGWRNRDKELNPDENKTRARERHIAHLKSLVIILASFFARSKNKNYKSIKALQEVASDHISKRSKFDIDGVINIFNAHEKGKIKEAEEAIKSVAIVLNNK